MHVDQDSGQDAPSRLLVAADTSIDPHRLVKICSDHAGGGAPSVSLLVPVDLDSRRSSESAARAEGTLRPATSLLDAAGVRLEDITLAGEDSAFVEPLVCSGGFDALLVCAAHGRRSSPVLPLAVRTAQINGLAVHGYGRHDAGPASWLRRVIPRRLRRTAATHGA
jgi:hypothetical protein